MWKIEKIVRKGDYNYAIVREHPNATKNGYVLEHRIVVENHLGRILGPEEVVHHKNGNRLDNRIENLEIMMVGEHESLHGKLRGQKTVVARCPNCHKVFEREYRQTHKVKGGSFTCCSRSCGNLFSYQLRKGITPELEKAVSENIVRVYKRRLDNSEQTDDNGMRRDHTPST